MNVKVAILTDLHFSRSADPGFPERQGEFAGILLLRAVHRLNRYIKPDLVVIGGDLLNRPDGEDARGLLTELKKTIDLLQFPVIVLRGNHDPEPEIFARIIGKPPEFIDINGVRFVPFADVEQPGFNAFRPPEALARMRRLGADFPGPLVSLQHVPLFPPGTGLAPYNYTNAAEIIGIMHAAGYAAAVSGHYHPGFELLDHQGASYIAAGALAERPFGYLLLEIDDAGRINCVREELAMPAELRLIDHHVHTELAYCNENMDIAKSIALGKMFNLDGLVFSEHSAHLYFNRPDYGRHADYLEGLASSAKTDRTAEYLALYAREADAFCRLGLEIDYDCRGQAVIAPEFKDKLEFRNGSVHVLNGILNGAEMKKIEAEFRFMTEAVAASGVEVLTHPFRIFKRRGLDLPRRLFAPTVEILKRYGTAAEINYHTNEPPPEFFRMCVENGVKLSLGSDAHNLYEVGEFYPHLKFLREIAPNSELCDLLIH
ncbi:MAG: metallophosphoesterase [Victivallaceae bacterium]|nr:metallophosphoesterase [Victivallaceae bacterium]